MGGLVVKKAYILGKHGDKYAGIISKVHGIVFLATPHKGSQYAKLLNNILSTAPLGAPPKAYVADLDTHAHAIQDINEQFRSSCTNLALVSFFETQKIGLGVKIFVDSAILGYPQEESSPLNGDHHTICKFKSRQDSNYKVVRNVLRKWVANLKCSRPSLSKSQQSSSSNVAKQIEAVFGIRDRAEEELNIVRAKVMDGTCQWVVQRKEYLQWMQGIDELQRSKMFWLVGLPATGKTILASVVVDDLVFRGHSCAYHFFSSAHQAKRTVAYCLRSIATQLAYANEEFRERLLAMREETGISFTSQNQDFQMIWDRIFDGIIFKMRFQSPLFWVLDALDEADSPSMLTSHLLKAHSVTPIKIFISSRPMRIPSLAAGYGSQITASFLTEKDTQSDIQAYVRHALRDALPEDEQIRDEITNQILSKASGSFLWVKVALETLQDNWHTQDDIQKALTELPQGMDDMYSKMLDTIERQPHRTRLIARRILTWTACSWRPLRITELEIALEPEFKGFVNLKDTIVQICGHFVSVDNSIVSLIHATARQFLLAKREGSSAYIDSLEGHEHIAGTCLQHLSNDGWRRLFKVVSTECPPGPKARRTNRLLIAEREHPFLGYSTCYWAYHVSKSRLESQLLDGLIKDFLSQYCLIWIEAIALSNNLRYLTRSAQYLRSYSKRKIRRSRHLTQDAPLSLKDPPEDHAATIQQWANDLIRVTGKFGSNLLQFPSSVYRLVPPFCPRRSMIGSTYLIRSFGALSVNGLSSDCWDDCLATVNAGDGRTASKVLAMHEYFLTLTKSTGTVLMWNANTCEEEKRLEHYEYVSHMVTNRSRTLLATAGIDNHRIWDVSSGKELHKFPVPQEATPMAIAISHDDAELIVGLDDCSVTGIEIASSRVRWRYYAEHPDGITHGCPKAMAFSPDLSRVAMAWRGYPPLIWDLNANERRNPQSPRVHGRADTIHNPESLIWHPDGDSLLILCQSAAIVEWHIYDDEQSEFDHVKPREMAVSLDGNLLLTSDHVGTISIWTFPRFNLIYRLINDNGFIRDLSFSPDGQRFYDTRGSLCNVWEPDVLVRTDEQDAGDQSSIGESSTMTEPVLTIDLTSQSQVTALAPDAKDAYFCCGRNDGTVFIHNVEDGQKIRKVYGHDTFTSVILLAWSPSGKYVASGDETGRILAKRLEVKETGKWAVFPVLDVRLPESAQQLLFNSNESLMLVSTSSADVVYDLKAKKEVCRQDWVVRQRRRWIEHPLDPGSLVWIDPDVVQTYRWATLQHGPCSDPSHKNIEEPGNPVSHSCRTNQTLPVPKSDTLVQWIALTQDRQYLVYETLPDTGHASSRSSSALHLEILPTSSLGTQKHPSRLSSECMADLAGQVKRLIGTYRDSMVFLDHEYWLCTWKIDADVHDVKRHFFLPKDWLNTATLQMATLNEHGTFFCPKYGDVAVVRHGIRF
ncbi:MAG: hypothetical protein Q9191_006015 [Dirinaria sp. TL-2023a]